MKLIPQQELDKGYNKLVHVEGWHQGVCFRYVETNVNGEHTIITPKTRRIYQTKNRLCYTKRNK